MRKAIVPLAALVLAIVTSGTLSVTESIANASPMPSVLTCAGKVVTRPSSYVVSCADANTYFTSIHWNTWRSQSASATATFVENNCEPSCAAGKFLRYPATITLSQPKSTKHGLLFSTMRYSYTVSSTWSLPLKTLSEMR